MTTSDEVLTAAQAAAYLKVCDKTLKRWRDAGRGPEWYRDSVGRVLYTRAALNAWLKTQFIATIVYAPINEAVAA